MTWDGSPITIPIIIAFVFFFIGLGGGWKRTIGYIVCTYASIVIASQRNTKYVDFFSAQFNLTETGMNRYQREALFFAIAVVVIFFVLRIIYGYVWKPLPSNRPYVPPDHTGWDNLLRGLICGALGWVLGSVLFAAGLGTAGFTLAGSANRREFVAQAQMITTTISILRYTIQPWVPGLLPAVLLV